MDYFYIEPEVAGGLGSDTVLDRSSHPPIVERLHYELEGWLGDGLLESFPAFIVTEAMKEALEEADVEGIVFDDVKITTGDQFKELYPNRKLPPFFWLKPVGQAGKDDIGMAEDGRLVVSEHALNALKKAGLANAIIEPYDG